VPRRSSSRKAAAGSAYDAGVRLLARRAHSRAELRRKLGRRGYDEAEIDEVVRRLAQAGYLDDAAFAAGHVRRRSESRGPLALAAELAARGVDRRLSDDALRGFDRQAQLAAATRLAARLAGHGRQAGYRELLNSVGPRLLRRGFGQAIAREACRAVWSGTASPSEP
jgi:regulatory protein